MFDEVELPPDADATLRDRIILVSSDEVKFYTHVNFMSAASPVLKRFYHGWQCETALKYTYGISFTLTHVETRYYFKMDIVTVYFKFLLVSAEYGWYRGI